MVWKEKPPEDKEKKIILLLGKGVPQRITQPKDLLKLDNIFYNNKIKPELDNCEVAYRLRKNFSCRKNLNLGRMQQKCKR